MNSLKTPGCTLRIVLPFVLDYLLPPFPNALDYDFDWECFGYGPLRSCALVCRDWTGPAQIALFTTAVVVRTLSPRDFSFPGAHRSFDSFISAVETHPELGAVVRSLAIVCSSKLLPRVLRALLLCSNVVRVNIKFHTMEPNSAELLSRFSAYPSVRALGTNMNDLHFNLKIILTIFPSLDTLHVLSFYANAMLSERLPVEESLRLRELSCAAFEAPWPDYFARVCVDPGIQVLRQLALEHADSDRVVMFKRSLLQLCVQYISLSQSDVDRIAECTSLRRLCLYEVSLFPRRWPPKLAVLEVKTAILHRLSLEDVRTLLRDAPSLKLVVLHRDHMEDELPTSADLYTMQDLKSLLKSSGVDFRVFAEVTPLQLFWTDLKDLDWRHYVYE